MNYIQCWSGFGTDSWTPDSQTVVKLQQLQPPEDFSGSHVAALYPKVECWCEKMHSGINTHVKHSDESSLISLEQYRAVSGHHCGLSLLFS